MNKRTWAKQTKMWSESGKFGVGEGKDEGDKHGPADENELAYNTPGKAWGAIQ